MNASASTPVLLLLLTASLASAADKPPSPTRSQDRGSEPKSYSTPLGDIEVAMIPDKHEAMIGEPVYLSFIIRNLSGKDLQSIQGGDYRNRFGRPATYSITVVDQHGKTLPILDSGPSFGGITGPQKIPANGTWVRRLFLPHWVQLAVAGDYTITCNTVLKLSKFTPGGWDHHETTTDTSVGVKTSLKVVPADKKRLGEVITALGNQMLDRNSDASDEGTRSLAWIADERVIPFFNKAMTTDNYSLRFAALAALSKFASDDALQGITVGLATKASDMRADPLAAQLANNIRHAAAVALSRSQHPEATKQLLSLWQDPNATVRIEVLHALGKLDSAESLELLRKMSIDTDEVTRNEAQRYLKLRTAKSKASGQK